MRRRGDGWYSRPAKSSKSQPLAIVWTRAAPSPRISSAIGAETATTASALRPTSRATRSPVRVGDDRVAQVGDPARAGRPTDGGADQVDGRRRRGRQDDVDVLAPGDPDRGGDRGEVPRHILVGDEPAAERECRLAAGALDPREAVELVGGEPSLRADVADAVHPGLRGWGEVVVAVHPLRVVRREHVRLDPERR